MYHHLLDKLSHWQSEWKASTLKNTLLLVALVLDQKTLNLWKLKGSAGRLLGNTRTDSRSHYQRLKRWLWRGADQKRLWVDIVVASARMLSQKTAILIIDGSSWESGGVCRHFLILSVLYRGVSVPVWWLELGRPGSSSYRQRKWLLQTAMCVFNLPGKTLVADREYIGHEWFKLLTDKGLNFAIRVRKGDYSGWIDREGRPLAKLETKATSQMGRTVWKQFRLDGQAYTYVLVAYRNRSGKVELLRLLTSLTPAAALRAYGQRYRIESMFRHLKSNGFDLQSLHVKQAYKVQLLMAVLVLAYTLAVIYGLVDFARKVGMKTYRANQGLQINSPQMSVFRFGLDKWQNHLQSLACFCDRILAYLNKYLNKYRKLETNLKNENVP